MGSAFPELLPVTGFRQRSNLQHIQRRYRPGFAPGYLVQQKAVRRRLCHGMGYQIVMGILTRKSRCVNAVMIVYRSKRRSRHGFSRGEAVKNLRYLTDEECGRKSNGYAPVSGFFIPTDFAIPHPTLLPLGHLFVKERLPPASDLF